MVLVEFNHQTSILESKFEGELTVKDIVEHITSTKDNESYPRFLKRVLDLTKATVNFPSSDLSILAEEHHKVIEKYDYIITAFILDTPRETAYSIIFQDLVKTDKSKIQLFSTREAALKWLGGY